MAAKYKIGKPQRAKRQKHELERSTQVNLLTTPQPVLPANSPQDKRVRLLKLKAKAVRMKVEMG